MAARTDYLRLHFIVFLWGFSAILGKLVTIPAFEMIFYRGMIAAAGMAIVIMATKGSFTVGHETAGEIDPDRIYRCVALGDIFRIGTSSQRFSKPCWVCH